MVVKKQITLKAGVTPAFIQCQGLFDVEYKIFVACRDGQVIVIRNGEVTDQVFRIEGRPLGMLLFEKQVVIAGMNSCLYGFYLKGKKNFSL